MSGSCLQQSDKPSFFLFLFVSLVSLGQVLSLCPWFSVLFKIVFVYLTEMNAMGETPSLLDLLLTHYLDVNACPHSLSVLIKKPKLFNGQNCQLLTLGGRRRESFNLIS